MANITLTTILKDQVSPGLDKIKTKAKQTGDQASQSFDRANNSMTKMKNNANGLMSSFTKIAGIFGVGMGFGKVLQLGMAQSDQLTKLTIAMNMNKEAAREVYDTIDEISVKTGADQASMVDGYKKLRLQGLKPTMKELKGMTNLALANNMQFSDLVEMMTNMEAGGPGKGMKKMGILVEDLGDKMNLTYKGMTKTVKNNTTDIIKYLSSLGMSGPDIIETMGDSQAGRMRAIYDKLEEVFERIFVKMEPYIDKFANWIETVDMGKLVENIILIGKAFATYKIVEGFLSIAKSVKDIGEFGGTGGWKNLLSLLGRTPAAPIAAGVAGTYAMGKYVQDNPDSPLMYGYRLQGEMYAARYRNKKKYNQGLKNQNFYDLTQGMSPAYDPTGAFGVRKENMFFNPTRPDYNGPLAPGMSGRVESSALVSKTTSPTTLSTERSIKNITINIDKQVGIENYNTNNALNMNKTELERIMTEILNKSIEDASVISK